MIYEFVDLESGARVEVSMPMRDAPPIDSIIEHDGRRLKRVMSAPASVAVDDFTPFSSIQMERNHPDAPRLDKFGRARFNTRQEVREFEAKTKASGGNQFHY